jgi:hypothetical protein
VVWASNTWAKEAGLGPTLGLKRLDWADPPATKKETDTKAMFGWYMLVLVVVVVFNTSKLTHKKLTPWMFGWRC